MEYFQAVKDLGQFDFDLSHNGRRGMLGPHMFPVHANRVGCPLRQLLERAAGDRIAGNSAT
jgi:hypothetical protein